MIELNQITLQFANAEKAILYDIDFKIKNGDFIILLGSNGSGKSSLLKLIDNRYQPSSGTILLNHKLLKQHSYKTLSKKIKTLTQNYNDAVFNSLTVFENYLLVKKARPSKQEFSYFENYLNAFNPNLAKKQNQLVEKLSGGEKQALALALTMLHPPEILLLDEHTSALDPKTAKEIMRLTQMFVTKHNITCILATHDLDIALQYGNQILALKQGKIFQSFEKEKALISREHLLSACY